MRPYARSFDNGFQEICDNSQPHRFWFATAMFIFHWINGPNSHTWNIRLLYYRIPRNFWNNVSESSPPPNWFIELELGFSRVRSYKYFLYKHRRCAAWFRVYNIIWNTLKSALSLISRFSWFKKNLTFIRAFLKLHFTTVIFNYFYVILS